MSSSLLVSLDQGVKRITINRPERRNALDEEASRGLLDALRWSGSDGTRVIVLTGAKESFCAGADLQSVAAAGPAMFDVTAWLRETTNPTILAMRELPIPIIARVHGPAVGIGCNLVMASDLVIASETATFGQAFVKVGLMPDGGRTCFLPRLVGYHKAFELTAFGEVLHALDALALGIVNRVVPHAALDGVVDDLARRLAHGPSTALARLKTALHHGEQSTLAESLDREALSQGDCARSPDFREGVAAFLEKRPAVFQ